MAEAAVGIAVLELRTASLTRSLNVAAHGWMTRAPLWIGRTNASAQVAWQRKLAVADDAIGYSLAITPDQGVIAVGMQEGDGPSAGWIVALDSAGGPGWQRTIKSGDERVVVASAVRSRSRNCSSNRPS